MKGYLHIIPCPSFKRFPKVLLMRQAPSPMLIEAIVGCDRNIVRGFDSILHGAEILPCVVFQGTEPRREENTYANLLWLQAQVRKHGFAEAKTPSSIEGSVAILYGDEEYMDSILLNELVVS